MNAASFDSAQDRTLSGLTAREAELLALLAEGLSNDEIGVRLGIESNTVRTHMSNIYAKLGVNSRSEAMLTVLTEQLRQAHAKTDALQARISEAQEEISHMAFYLSRAVDLLAKLAGE